jgi:hypothetical protein
MKKFGFTADHVVEAARRQLAGGDDSSAKVNDAASASTKGGAPQ